MAQADYIISNQTFPNTRADINNHLSAIATNNSGTSAPTTQYAGQFWIDTTTTTWTLYIHDGTDDIQFATIDTSANTVNFIDSALDVVTDTTPQLGGDLDLNSNDITGTGNINITGTATVSGDLTVDTDTLFVDASANAVGIGTSSPSFSAFGSTSKGLHISNANPTLRLEDTDTSDSSFISQVGSALFITNQGAGEARIYTNNTERMRIDSSGNVIVGKTSTDLGTAGQALLSSGVSFFTRDGDKVLRVNRLTSDGDIIDLLKDGTTVGSIGASGGQIYVASTGGATYTFENGAFFGSDEDRDLGKSNRRFKDAYLSGNIYLGGTGSANALDDYEEGAWTPVFNGSTTAGSYTYGVQGGRYTKIGRFVTVHCELFNITTLSAGSGQARISGLPFTRDAGQNEYVGICRLDSFSFAGSYVTADALVTSDNIIFREMISGSPDGIMSITDKVDNNADILCTISYITS